MKPLIKVGADPNVPKFSYASVTTFAFTQLLLVLEFLMSSGFQIIIYSSDEPEEMFVFYIDSKSNSLFRGLQMCKQMSLGMVVYLPTVPPTT
jgi:hypothetical protein